MYEDELLVPFRVGTGVIYLWSWVSDLVAIYEGKLRNWPGALSHRILVQISFFCAQTLLVPFVRPSYLKSTITTKTAKNVSCWNGWGVNWNVTIIQVMKVQMCSTFMTEICSPKRRMGIGISRLRKWCSHEFEGLRDSLNSFNDLLIEGYWHTNK